MTIDEPIPLAPEEGLRHSMYLTSMIVLPPNSNPVECLDPLKQVSLNHKTMTSFDMPKAVQAGFDIECGKVGRFFGNTTYWNSPIICMCVVARKFGDSDAYKPKTFEAEKGYKYFGFMLGTVRKRPKDSELNGPDIIYEFAQEDVMIRCYKYFYKVMRARYWVTHNGKLFDMPRILNRGTLLGLAHEYLGYIPAQATRITQRQFSSRAHSERTITSLDFECGIIQLDTLETFNRERKDRRNGLGAISGLLLGMTKHDMPYEAIMGHWLESDKSRRILLDYCFRDSQLPLQLIAHSKLIVALTQLSRASGYISEGMISEKGMTEKVLGAFFKGNRQEGMLYILRTNDYFSNRHNEELITAQDLIEKYQNQAEDAAAKKKRKKGKEELVVASINVGSSFSGETIATAKTPKQKASTAQPSTKRQRAHTKKNIKPEAGASTSILQYFKANQAPGKCEQVHKDKDGKVIPMKKWNNINKQRFTRVKVEEHNDSSEDDTIDTAHDYSPTDSDKGKIRNRPAEPPPKITLAKFGTTHDGPVDLKSGERFEATIAASSNQVSCTDDDSQEQQETVEQRIKRLHEIQRDLAQAKATKNVFAARDAEYKGAVVMKEKLGWYWELPSLCIDFEGLYPSIMMCSNHGSNTKIYEDEMGERGVTLDMLIEPAKEQRVKNPRTGAVGRLFFLKPEIWKGMLAVAERMLLDLRNAAKKLIDFFGNEFLDADKTPNPNYNKLLSAIALAASNNIKLLMNSMYGITGADHGVLADKHIAGSVTGCGRESIVLTRSETMKEFGAICAGGDTDSVFMQFPGLEYGMYEKKWAIACKQAAKLGPDDDPGPAIFPQLRHGELRLKTMKDIVEFAQNIWVPFINKNFKSPMKVAFEKAMFRLCTFAPKRYSFFYNFVGKDPYLTSKGLETIRRDALPFTQKVLKNLFDIIQVMPKDEHTDEEDKEVVQGLKQKAVDYVREKARQLARGDVPISDLILSKQRSREYYTNQNQEHLTVVRKLEELGLEAPSVGSRVFFVYTHIREDVKGKGQKGYEIAHDPEYVVRNGIPINYSHYVETKFIKSMVRTLAYFLYDEMVERVSKRKYDEYTYGITSGIRSAKRQRIVLDAQGNIPVTLKEIREETEQYLFATAKKGTAEARNQQTRYLNLTGGRARQENIDATDKTRISGYAKKDETRFDKLRRVYNTNDHRVIIKNELEILTKNADNYDKCLNTCRTCLKIPTTKEVFCVAPNCEQYLPRISAMGEQTQGEDKMRELCADIEDLFTSNCNIPSNVAH